MVQGVLFFVSTGRRKLAIAQDEVLNLNLDFFGIGTLVNLFHGYSLCVLPVIYNSRVTAKIENDFQ